MQLDFHSVMRIPFYSRNIHSSSQDVGGAKLYLRQSLLSQMNLIHFCTPCFFKINFNIVLPKTRSFLESSASLSFINYYSLFIYHLTLVFYMAC
jgi:hypothetical protein